MSHNHLRIAGILIAGAFAAGLSTSAVQAKTVYTQLYAFQGGNDGGAPRGALVNLNGTLYGVTQAGGGTGCGGSGCGTVFTVNPAGGVSLLYAFQDGTDGNQPVGGLTKVGGNLYGATLYGGAHGVGSVFSITPGGVENIVYSFQNNGSDGILPLSSLFYQNGTFYGTTASGGPTYNGTVFSVTPGGVENVIYAFKGGTDGSYPISGVFLHAGTTSQIFGATSQGGSQGDGTVFSVSQSTGAEKVLHTFLGSPDAIGPSPDFLSIGDTFYGTSERGGSSGNGTIFSINSRGVENVLYSFQGQDGQDPFNQHLIEVHGKFYGTTRLGGANSWGSVFSITPAGKLTVLYSFKGGADGGEPYGGLLFLNGTLYGTTYFGGVGSCAPVGYGCGTVFSIKLP